jgi:hypothetical protein
MATENFKPVLWSARLQANLDKQHVFANPAIVNRDYEGEIKNGGTSVKINTMGDITIGNYDKTAGVGTPQELDSNQTILVIDQQKYFNFAVDDVDAVQANVTLVDKAMARASYALSEVTDKFIAGLYTGASASNLVGDDATPVQITNADQAYAQVLELKKKLDKANVSKVGRWIILDTDFLGFLVSDSRFVSNMQLGQGVIENGSIGRILGFDVFESNNVPNVTGANANTKILAGHPSAITYAEQLIKIEAYRPEGSFSDAVKGLMVYGAKVVQPSALAVLSYKL